MGCSFLFLLALVRVQHGCAKRRIRAYTSWCLGAVSSNMEFLLLVLYIKATTTAHKTFLLKRDWWSGADLLLCREILGFLQPVFVSEEMWMGRSSSIHPYIDLEENSQISHKVLGCHAPFLQHECCWDRAVVPALPQRLSPQELWRCRARSKPTDQHSKLCSLHL